MHELIVPEDFSKYPSIKMAGMFVGKPESVKKFEEAVIWPAKETNKSSATAHGIQMF